MVAPPFETTERRNRIGIVFSWLTPDGLVPTTPQFPMSEEDALRLLEADIACFGEPSTGGLR